MTYTFKQNLVAKDKYPIKCPNAMTAEFIVVHNTANDASAENEIKYMITNNNQVSYHYAVDDEMVIQGLPVDRNAWACGDGSKGQGNRKGIQVEICYSKSGGARFENAEKNAAMFIAQLLKERGWGIDKVKKHQDFANKYCPHRTLDKGWASFVNMVKDYLKESNIQTPSTNSTFKVGDQVKVKTSATHYSTGQSIASFVKGMVKDYLKESNIQTPSTNSTFKVGDQVKVKTSATHYSTGQSIASFVKGSTYEVTKVDGNKLLLSDITSWVWDYDVERISESQSQPTLFKVKITCDSLNIRQHASFDSKVVGTVKKGDVFTITDEQNGLYKLKSGAGWISANSKYSQKI